MSRSYVHPAVSVGVESVHYIASSYAPLLKHETKKAIQIEYLYLYLSIYTATLPSRVLWAGKSARRLLV